MTYNNSQYSKITIVLGLYLVSIIVSSCRQCPSRDIDFSKISVNYNLWDPHSPHPSLRLDEEFGNLYEDMVKLDKNKGIVIYIHDYLNSYKQEADGCPDNNRAKYWVSDVDIVVKGNWDKDHLSGTSLRDITEVYSEKQQRRVPLSVMPFDDPYEGFQSQNPPRLLYIRLYLAHPPVAGEYKFIFTVTKSNGEQIVVSSPPIGWE